MIINRSPYRVSFFGGGTDYYSWFKDHGGDILSTSINHYTYISCRYLPPFHAEYRNRIAWRIIEYPNSVDQIQHKAIKAALIHYNIDKGIEISNQCDLPARSGLGSSSSFCSSLINGICALKGEMMTKYDLAKATIHLEREILKEDGGIQDQIAAVYGGLNHIHINPDSSFLVNPIIVSEKRKKLFNEHLLLFFTGVSRNSSDVACKQIKSVTNNKSQLTRMQKMVFEACKILSSEHEDLDNFGYLLHETWTLKRSLTSKVSNSLIDEVYEIGIKSGALGGKILGAGGGGFILFYAKPENHSNIIKALHNLIHVPFKFDNQGCHIVYYSPTEYSPETYQKHNYIHMKNQYNNLS